MAVEADRVVVELIAQTQGFDTQLKQSGQNFTSTMSEVTKASKGVETAANDVYTAHNRMGIATNNARIAQMELQHVIRGSVDSYASGGSAVQIFAQHIASVAEAATFMGGSLGAVGEILAGPWGIAITAGVAILATLISRHKEEAESVDTLVEKLKKNHDHTQLQAEADQRWSNTLDGLLDKLHRLNEETGKRLELPIVVNQQASANAQAIVDSLGRQLEKAENDPTSSAKRLEKLNDAFAAAVKNAYQQTIISGEQEGAALADLNKRSDDWAASQTDIIRRLLGYHPELEASAAAINAAFEQMKKAVGDAAKGNVPFDAVTRQVDALNNKLADSPGFVKDYISQLKLLAAQLEHTVDAAKDAPKAISDFEKAVIGAEGTGANKLGSSASGFGQFMPSTWLSYFNKLFPDKAELSDAAKLGFRDVRSVADAVIDSATKDYVALLKRLGENVTAANLYTVHLLGNRDATKLLQASPGTPTSDFLSSAVLRGNPFLQGTAGDARSAIAKRIGDSSGPISSGAVAIDQALAEQAKKEIEQQAAFTSERDKLNVQLLGSLKEVSKNYEQEAIAEQAQITAKHDAEAATIASNLAEGKYGAATSALAQNRAKQLATANDQVAAQQSAVLAVKTFLNQQEELTKNSNLAFQITSGGLKYEEQLAVSQKDRIAIERKIIDATYDHQQNVLEIARKSAVEVQNWAEVDRLDKQIANIPTQRARDLSLAGGEVAKLIDAEKELNRFGEMFVDDVLNPDNWTSFGDIGKKVLHDLEGELITLAALNPLKNLLFGSNLPTIGGIFTKLFGGGGASFDQGTLDPFVQLAGARASGGPVSSGGTYLVGENGPELFRPSSSGMILPSNAVAANAGGGGSGGVVRVVIEASPYFDGRVMQVSGPVIAQAAVAAANGGASIGRRNLGRESMHRLE